MKKGLILTNAYSGLAAAENQPSRLKQEFSRLGVTADVRQNDGLGTFIGGDGEIACNLTNYDFCVYLDKDKYVSQMLEKSGMRLFNSHAAIRLCDDKMQTHIALSGAGICMPKTLPGLLCYSPQAGLKEEAIAKIEKLFGYPVIVKSCYGSLGSGVFKADSRTALCALCERLKCSPHLFQEFIEESAGMDVRVIAVGGEAVAAMLRRSSADFRSNIGLGGRGEKIALDDNLKTLCRRVSQILRLDYCGIDLLLKKDGYCVCEVNSNAFFGGIECVTGVNVAKIYAEYIYSQIYG